MLSLANQPQQNQITDFNTGRPENVLGYETPASAEAKSPAQDTGTLVVNDEGTSYIDSANWRAILEEVCFVFGCSSALRGLFAFL